MSYSKPDEIQQIEHIISEGKYELALSEITNLEVQGNLSALDQVNCQILKSSVLTKVGKSNDALEIVEQLITKNNFLGNTLAHLDAMISKAHILATSGEIEKGYEAINKATEIFKTLTDISKEQLILRKASMLCIKGNLLERSEDLKTALDNYLQSLSIRREIDHRPGIAISLCHIANLYYKLGDVIRSQLIYQQSLEIFRELGNDIETAYILDKIGNIYLWQGDYGLALEHCLQSLAIGEETSNEFSLAIFLNTVAHIFYHLGEHDRALKYLERCLSLREEINYQTGIAETLNYLSLIFYKKGELEKAQNYQTQSFTILNKLDDKAGLAYTIETEGKIAFQMGEIQKSILAFKESLRLRESQKNKKSLAGVLYWLIIANIENHALNMSQVYLQRLQKVIEKENNAISEQRYRLASALILKLSNKREILFKAKELLISIVDGVLLDHGMLIRSLYNLCEIHLKEIEIFEDHEAVVQLEGRIEMHYDIAKQIGSHTMIAENYWLKAQLEMMKNNYQEAKILLNEATQITEDKAFRRLALKIPDLMNIINKYASPGEELEKGFIHAETQNNLHEQLNDEVVRMVNKRTVELPKLQDEEPVLLIIVYEGGVTVFSQKFSQREMIDEMFVGGFLTAIDAFMHQTFATGGSIERIKHQEYTLMLKGENPLLFCYVFKGQSFSAIQKLDVLIRDLQKSPVMWNALTNNIGEQVPNAEKEMIEELANKIFLSET
ncbi:MAG: tetratricopeptide repeat protein [Candidatus Heimdallarchaeota archaeon]